MLVQTESQAIELLQAYMLGENIIALHVDDNGVITDSSGHIYNLPTSNTETEER